MPTGRESQSFLPPDAEKFSGRIVDWEQSSRSYEREPEGIEYPAYRMEGREVEGERTIEACHNESFVDYIRQLIAQKDSAGDKSKVKILDVGGGAAMFADQLRRTFGDRIKVYTTGLRKQSAELLRASLKQKSAEDAGGLEPFEMSSRLHKDDLKWRSILQLSDYPEFDLIVDTFGEFEYANIQKYEIYLREAKYKKGDKENDAYGKEYGDRVEQYLNAVVNKLLPCGKASILFFIGHRQVPTMIKEILKKFKDLIDFTIIRRETTGSKGEFECLLKIKKKQLS